MATRLRAMHGDEIRAKIQTSQLINRLTNHALGKVDLSPTQVRSIEVLIRKTLPDLQSVQLTGPDGGPVQLQNVTRRIVDPTLIHDV